MARNELPYVIECNSQGWWEKIAAFNCEPPAVGYMKDCASVSFRGEPPSYKYRVRKGRKIIAGAGS
jgi:hypothetical protein